MALTRLQIVTEAANNIGRKLTALSMDGSTTIKDRLIRALNESVQPWVARGVTDDTPDGFFFTELNKTADATTVADRKAYLFPSSMREIYTLTLIDGSDSRKLEQVPRRRIEELFPDPTTWPTSTRPKWYTRYGQGFELIPIPDDAYTIRARYSVHPTDLDADGDTSDFVDKDDLLVTRLTAEGYYMLQEYEEDADAWMRKSEALLLSAISADPREWDWSRVHIGFEPVEVAEGEYWKNPWHGL